MRLLEYFKSNKDISVFATFFIISLILLLLGQTESSLVIFLMISIPLLMFVYRKQEISEDVFHVVWTFVLYVITALGIFSIVYFEHGLLYNNDIVYSFKDSVYFSIVTWTTLGYGDFQPTEEVRLWASIQAFFGYCFMATFVALFFNSVIKASEAKKCKPIKLKAIEKAFNLVAIIQSALVNATDSSPQNQPHMKYYIDKFVSKVKEFDQFVDVHGSAIGVPLLTSFIEMRTSLDAIYQKLQCAYQIKDIKNKFICESPLKEIERIEKVLSNIQNANPMLYKDDRLLNVYGLAVIEQHWKAFKKKHVIFEPEEYEPRGDKLITCLNIDHAKKVKAVVGMQINTLFND